MIEGLNGWGLTSKAVDSYSSIPLVHYILCSNDSCYVAYGGTFVLVVLHRMTSLEGDCSSTTWNLGRSDVHGGYGNESGTSLCFFPCMS